MIAEQNQDEKKEERIIKSCCFELDSLFTTYISKIIFSSIVLGICTVMLIDAQGDCSKSSPYHNIISFMVAKILNDIVIKH